MKALAIYYLFKAIAYPKVALRATYIYLLGKLINNLKPI